MFKVSEVLCCHFLNAFLEMNCFMFNGTVCVRVLFLFSFRLPYILFQGGMPRASYGDRHSISVVHGNQQTAFDFTSRVIDFFVISSDDPFAGM